MHQSLVHSCYGTLVTLIHIISNNNSFNPYKFKLNQHIFGAMHLSTNPRYILAMAF